MSNEDFARQVQAAIQSGKVGTHIIEKGVRKALSIASEAARQTEERSERIKKDKLRGARGTTHRISL